MLAKKKDIFSWGLTKETSHDIVLGKNPFSGEPLFDSFNDNVMVLGLPRSGKGVNTVIPTAFTWKNSMVCFDPKGTIFKNTSNYREAVLGQKIFMFHPYATDGTSVKWNFFDDIRYNTTMEYRDIVCICSAILGIDEDKISYYVSYPSEYVKKNRYYYLSLILTGLFICQKCKENPTIIDLLSYVNTHSLDEIVNFMLSCPKEFQSSYKVYNDKFKEIIDFPIEQQQSILQDLKNILIPFSAELCGNNLSRSDFTLSDLIDLSNPNIIKSQKFSFYICLSINNIPNEGIVATLFLQMLMQRLNEYMIKWLLPVNKKIIDTQFLFLIDEIHILPKLNNLYSILSYSAICGYVRFCISLLTVNYLKQVYISEKCFDKESDFNKIINLFSHRVFLSGLDNLSLNFAVQELSADIPDNRLTVEELSIFPVDKVIIHLKGKSPLFADKLRYYKDNYFTKILEGKYYV